MTNLRGESVKRLLKSLEDCDFFSEFAQSVHAELLRRFERDAAKIKKLTAELKRQQKAKVTRGHEIGCGCRSCVWGDK